MTNEEFDRKISFIVEQQAQFASDILDLRELQARTEENVGRLATATREGFGITLEGFKDVNAKLDALVDSQIRLTEAQNRTDKNLAITDEKLRNLIAVADRYFRDKRNGA